MKNINKALIRKYINNNCTPAELQDLKRLMLMPDTKDLFDEVLSENWIGLVDEKNIDQPQLNRKLQQFYNRLEEEAAQEVKQTNSSMLKIKRYLPYAAIWIIGILGIGTYSLLHFKKTPLSEQVVMRHMVNPNGQRSTITLPDGSEVFLGAGSKLSFPQQFAVNTREITLEGEAFFQVTKNPKRPFIIHTGSIQTKVLGTSFKITAFPNHPVSVAVATGKVRVDDYLKNGIRQLAVLTPGQEVIYAGTVAEQHLVDVNEVKSWKDARLSFHDRPLKEITAELERWYNVKIAYQHELKSAERISVVLHADIPLNKIMKVLSATGHFKYQISERNVYIK